MPTKKNVNSFKNLFHFGVGIDWGWVSSVSTAMGCHAIAQAVSFWLPTMVAQG
jgi:hypothetical protein